MDDSFSELIQFPVWLERERGAGGEHGEVGGVGEEREGEEVGWRRRRGRGSRTRQDQAWAYG